MVVKRKAGDNKGRKNLFKIKNIFSIFLTVLFFSYLLHSGWYILAYFCMGMLVGRIGEIIFEIKDNLFDKPFLHFLFGLAIPIQILYNIFTR